MRFLSRLTVAVAVTVCLARGQTATKKRVAVFDFDNAAVKSGMSSPFFTTGQANLGKAVADLLLNRLVQSGSVSVIERSALDKVLSEQNLTNSDRADALTAAKIGRILGVDAIILGSITQYDFDDKTTGGGGARLGGFGGSSMKVKHDSKASVQISARLVSPDTAEVISVAQGSGVVEKKGVKVDIRDTSRSMAVFTGATNSPLMTEAMDHAVTELATRLDGNLTKLPPRTPVIEGLVADAASSGRLILNVGANHGVKQGDRLQVWRLGKEVRDPATGRLLMRDDTLLGEAVINTVQEISSIASYGGTEAVKVGDIVKSPPRQK